MLTQPIRSLRFVLAIILGGHCGAVSAAGSPVFYFIAHAGPGDPYWSVQAKAAAEAGKKLGARVVFSAPDRPGDIARQVELLTAAIAARPDGIATTIPDARAFGPAIQKARKQGIPVVAVNAREMKRDPELLPYQAYIGMDEREAGRRVADHAVKALGLVRGQSVVVGNHQPGVSGLELRSQGISDILSKLGVTVDRLDLGSNPAKAVTILESYLKSKPKTRAVFTLGALGYTAAAKAIIPSGSSLASIALIGFDVDPVAMALIEKGVMAFTLDAQPYLQAFGAITQLYLAARAGVTPVDMSTGVGIVDRAALPRLSKLIESGYVVE